MLVTAYANGLAMGTPPAPSNHKRAKRGTIQGWTAGAVRRHTRWLYSVEVERLLRDEGVAYTLTLGELPPIAEEWTRLVKLWCDRLGAQGARRIHWVVEWQRRGVPHLHAAVYWDARIEPHEGIAKGLLAWLDLAQPYGAQWGGQDAKPIDGAEGWLAYLSKHAARGVRHYQRMGKPEGWESTGRLWGKRGDWPLGDPMRMRVDEDGSYRLRRLVRSWRIADARAELAAAIAARIATARRRIASARRMLSKPYPERARTMGVSEWMRPDVAGPLLALLRADGYRVGLADEHTEAEWARPELMGPPICPGCKRMLRPDGSHVRPRPARQKRRRK